MTLERPTIVIFDMDGTTVRHINLMLLHILEKLDDFGYLISRFFRWLFRRGAQGPIIPDDEDFLNRRKPRLFVHRAIHTFRRKEVDQIVEPCPGIYTVLDFLKKQGVPMALASNGLGKGYGDDILKKFDLEGYFGATIFREDVSKSKPNPEGLLLALNQMGAQVSKGDVIWHIGDRHKDVKAALAANEHLPAKVVPVAYGLNAATAVLEKNLSPDHIIMSYTDMHDRLKDLFRDAPGKGNTSEEVPKPKIKKKKSA
ncbi:MAG: HAD family phosphatase [Alphaproteobacteria bacterium]|nr:HAD family phosphatase [Alphaproteobacteria bacterium]